MLLAAPVLPLLGVAASWSRVFDPAYDLVAATPAAGLSLLLRRTAVVLAVIVPAALLAGVVTDADGVATWLLPCLALTAAALALGSVTGLVRATSAGRGARGRPESWRPRSRCTRRPRRSNQPGCPSGER